MTTVEEVQSFNEFVVNEVFNALYYVSGVFTVVTSLCEDDEEEGHVIRKECSPSKLLLTKQQSSEKKDELDLPKGLFALSFEKIPCNEPIKPCQFRTGRRYIQPDNFPDDDGLDHYLGYMAKLSSKLSDAKILPNGFQIRNVHAKIWLAMFFPSAKWITQSNYKIEKSALLYGIKPFRLACVTLNNFHFCVDF